MIFFLITIILFAIDILMNLCNSQLFFMKSILPLLLLVGLLLNGCEPKRQNYDICLRLLASINDTAETIKLGDSLKISLTIPDTLVTDTGKLVIKSLQVANFYFTLYKIDTISTQRPTPNDSIIYGNSKSISVTNGVCNSSQVNMATNTRPYTSTLNILPPSKGLFIVQIEPQPGNIGVNSSSNYIGLAVNFSVVNKHWNLFESYNPGFINAIIPIDYSGFGSYCFRVK